MNTYPITELEDGTTFSDHLFLDEKFQLLDKEVPFSDAMKKALAAWDFRVVLSDGNAKPPEHEDEDAPEGEGASHAPQQEIPQNVNYESVDLENLLGLPHVEQPKEPEPPEPPTEVPDLPVLEKNISVNDLDDLFGSLDAPLDVSAPEAETAAPETKADSAPAQAEDSDASDIPETKADDASETLSATPAFDAEADEEKLSQTRAFYNEYLDYIDTVFKSYTQTKTLEIQPLAQKIDELTVFIKENQRYLLRIMPTDEAKNKHFLVNHSMRSTVLALIIGITLKLPAEKLTDLGVASLLHEIGQIRLPPQLYMTDRPLSDEEKGKMAAHPILSYNILKENQFPLSIQIATLEHHEREDGTGYPRKLTGEKISAFAKIISVACSFEAITAPRQFREARTPYEALLDILKNNEQQYDQIVLKALIHSLSLFPIGAFVRLANGQTAQVIDINPGHPKNPVVKVVGEASEYETDDSDHKIVRVLNAQESEALKD